MLLSGLAIIWGVLGIKTFKPIIKDLNHVPTYGVRAMGSPTKHSASIKVFKKKFIKILVASIVITFVAMLTGRDLIMDATDDLIDQEYDQREN